MLRKSDESFEGMGTGICIIMIILVVIIGIIAIVIVVVVIIIIITVVIIVVIIIIGIIIIIIILVIIITLFIIITLVIIIILAVVVIIIILAVVIIIIIIAVIIAVIISCSSRSSKGSERIRQLMPGSAFHAAHHHRPEDPHGIIKERNSVGKHPGHEEHAGREKCPPEPPFYAFGVRGGRRHAEVSCPADNLLPGFVGGGGDDEAKSTHL